jgi:hypothetical protein
MMQFRFSRIAVLVAAIGFAAAPELTNIAANTALLRKRCALKSAVLCRLPVIFTGEKI